MSLYFGLMLEMMVVLYYARENGTEYFATYSSVRCSQISRQNIKA